MFYTASAEPMPSQESSESEGHDISLAVPYWTIIRSRSIVSVAIK
jgi:hypothetical protein